MSFPVAGFNPVFGRDAGPPPPLVPPSGPPTSPDYGAPPPGTSNAGQAYYPIPGQQPPMYYYYPGYYTPPPPYGAVVPPPPALPQPIGTTIAVDERGQIYQYISGLNGSGRVPQPPPAVDPDFPAANLINSTGGVGAEPGFNYFFPTQHAKVVVLKCEVPPWKLVPGTHADLPFHACKVPANVTMAELLVGFGAQNPDKGKNQLWEVYPQGAGLWGWKEHVRGDDEVMAIRTVREMGWVEKPDGVLPTIYLWISKA